MIEDWLSIPYKAYARGREASDCWGLVCIVRKAIRGDDLPSYVEVHDKRALTHAAHEFFSTGFVETRNIRPGTIVFVWRGRVCLHAGIVIEVDGRLAIIDSTEQRGVAWRWVADYERQHYKITYHDNDDQGLSVHPAG